MSTIVTRAGKGSALTWTEGDANLTNLNNDKIEDIVEDTSPQLGGDLDVNSHSIVSTSNGNIAIMPNGSGNIQLIPTTGKITLGACDWPTTTGSTGQVLTSGGGAGTLTWSTISSGGIASVSEDTAPVLGGLLDLNGNVIQDHYQSGNLTNPSIGSGGPSGVDWVIHPGTNASSVVGNVRLGDAYLKFPNVDGTANQVIKTDGSGQLSWTTISSGISSVSADTAPSLGGDLSVAGHSIVSTSNGNINITPNGSGNINLSPATGHVTISAVNFPTGDGTANQVLKTNGSGQLSWTTITPGAGTVTSVGGTGTANGLTLTGTVTSSGSLTLGGTLDLTSPPAIGGTTASTGRFTTLTSTGRIVMKDLTETVYTSGSTTGTITPDVANGTVQKITLTGSITFNAFANPVAGQSLTLIVTQSAAGSLTLTSTMKFAGASKTLSTAANAIDIITVFYDGSTYWASLGKGFA